MAPWTRPRPGAIAGRPSRSLEPGVALSLTALAVVLHVEFARHAGGLWRDEVNTVELAASPSLAELSRSLRYDGYPIAAPLLVRAWLATPWGHGDTGLRVLGFLIGLAVLATIWIAARQLRCPAPLFSVALIGLNAVAIRTTDSIRPHGPGLALLLLTLALIWRLLASPRLPLVVLAGVAAVSSVQFTYQNALLLSGFGGAALWLAARRRDARAVAAIGIVCAAAAASLLPYAADLRAARDWNVVNQGPTSPAHLATMLAVAMGGGSAIAAGLWLAPLWLAAAATRGGRRTVPRSDLPRFAALAAAASAAVFLLVLGTSRLPTQPWYYVPLLGPIALLLDAVIASAPGAARRLLTVTAAAVIALALAVPGWGRVRERRTNVDLLARELERRAAPRDLILVAPWYAGVGFHHYYHGGAQWLTIPPLADLRLHRYDLLKSVMSGPDPMGPVLDRVARSLAAGGRVWLAGALPAPDPAHPPAPLPAAPGGPGGWNCDPYLRGWGQELSWFLAAHGSRAAAVPPLTAQPVNPLEDLALGVVEGWR